MATINLNNNFDYASNAFVNTGNQAALTPSESSVQYDAGSFPVKFEGQFQAPYEINERPSTQGFDLDQSVSSRMAEMAERRQETSGMQSQETTRQQQTDERQQQEQTRQQQDRIASGMAQPVAQQQQQQQQVQAQQASPQEVQAPQQQDNAPQLSDLGVQSKRERTNSLEDALGADNQFAKSGVEYANVTERDVNTVYDKAMGRRTTPVSDNITERQMMAANRSAADRAIRREIEQQSQSEEQKPWWANPVERMVRFSQNASIRPQAVIDAVKKRAARTFKKEMVGGRIYGKMLGLSTLDFQEVGVGFRELIAVIEQNPTMLEELLKANIGEDIPPVGMMKTNDLIKLINSNDIWVATFKPPDNQGQDMQRRKLRILTQQQRGIYLHNIMAAMYTADYDGDDMAISLDPAVAQNTKDPMDYMVDIYGNISLNIDFLPVAKIVPVDNMNEESYVKNVILADFSIDDSGNEIDGRTLSPLVDSILELGKTADKNTDAQAEAYGDVFRQARKFADRLDYKNSNNKMSDICRAVFDNMRRIRYYNSLSTIGADVLSLKENEVPAPVTYGDNLAYAILDGMVNGKMPNNFQELKLLLTGFTGNVEGKNAPFRFTADVGKMMKMDERLMVGDHFELDTNDDMQMELFFKTTVKYAGSLKMAREIKKAGRSEYYTQTLRESVIREAKFPENYDSFHEFLDAFVKSYNKNSAIINEANSVFLTNMGLSSEPNGVVSALKKSGKDKDGNIVDYTLSDLAEPLLSVYGIYSVGKVFRNLQKSGFMKRENRDAYFAGNPSATKRERWSEREYDFIDDKSRFWITGKYIDYSLRQFRNENRIIRGDSGLDDERDRFGNVTKEGIRNRKLSDTNDDDVIAQFEMLLAIADKRTGAASKFNDSTYGMMEKGHRSDEKTTVRYMSTLLTSVAAAMREGNEVISPGFYAGIGQRKVPKSVQSHMTSLAKRLNKMNFTLRSGDAEGSDQAFQSGAGRNASIFKASSENTLSESAVGNVTFFDKMSDAEQKAAYDSIARLHPSGGSISDNHSRNLLARDYFQVIGTGGLVDSAFIACYADQNEGGTWQAIRIARERGIPVFNAAEYSNLDDWERDVIDAATKVNMGTLRTSSISNDQALQIDEAISALIMANPDVFHHFNMDSTASFLDSSWGKKMLQYSDNLEMLGGIYTSMIFDYRMERVNSLMERFLTLDDTSRLEETWNDLLFAKDELGSTSEVWHGILREFDAEETSGEKSFFQMMREHKIKQQAIDGFMYEWKPEYYDGKDFWANPGEHHSLRSLIEDLNVDRQTKWNVIADVVRYWEKDIGLKSYEVGYQLEIGNDSAYTLGSAPDKAALATHRDFEKAFNRWGRSSQTALREDVDRARAGYSSTPRALMTTIERLDKEPWELVSIDSLMYADSLLSVYDKTYAQTEKASQNPWTNAIYAALSFQQVGEYKNDINRTDDRLLGLVSVDSITIQDVIHLLANPNESMTVYGRRGELGVISRDILLQNEIGELSGDIEADMWEFLSRSPRIASAIRKHSACVVQNSEGKGYLGASNSIAETIESLKDGEANPLEQTKYLMRDHPGYAGIISLALPGSGLVTRNARTRVKQIEDFLSYELYAAATSDWNASVIAETILGDLGITEEGLKSVLRSGYDTFLEKQGLDAYKYVEDKKLESDRDAEMTYYHARRFITNYITELRNPENNVVLGKYIDMPADPKFNGPDAVSAAAFWDVIQELSGAKTLVSTGIEGSETYKFAEWISHINATDRYADLDVLTENEDFGPDWNGMWTNVVAEDGGRILLEVDENGNVANMDLLKEISESQNIDTIVVEVPEGYKIKDRSTDSHGTQVASLFAYMVSKRSNGAEAFNLKAKKAGIDELDSISKKLPGGKYKVKRVEKPDGKYETVKVNFAEIAEELSQLAQSGGMKAAQMRLAQMMLEENKEIGYKDLNLANYMSIAELMLIEGQADENGKSTVYLRSLEMLASAIKYRIGWKIDDMNDEQLTNAVNEIVQDNSENGVGIMQMQAFEALDGFKPRSRSMQHNAVRQSSSIFQRNYDLLSEIKSKTTIEPLTISEAEDINKKLSGVILGQNKKMSKVIDFLNGYNIISAIGFGEQDEIHKSIGPRNVLFVGPNVTDKNTLTNELRKAYSLGMTVVCDSSSLSMLPNFLAKTAVPILDPDDNDLGPVLIPCFDARLNGSEATPYRGGFSIAQVPFSSYVVSVEDSTNEFSLGDAEGQALSHLTDNMKMIQTGTATVTAESLFPNVFKNPAFRDCSFTVGLANGDTIRNMISESVNCTIDYGIVEGAEGFDQRVSDVDKAIKRYQDRWNLANPDGIMMGVDDCKPGDIVGWAEIEIVYPDGSTQYVLAPIIPFQLHGVKKQPSSFSVENFGPVDDATLFQFDWRNSTDLTEEFVKYFDSSGGANKGMISLSQALEESRTLLDGTPLDVYIAKESTDSRKVGTDRRIKTMISLMTLARMHGYNFARNADGTPNEGAFPDNPEIRERLIHERISTDEWKVMLENKTRFAIDETLNAFVRYECQKVIDNGGNPSDYLANVYENENGELENTHVMWEFEAMFDQGLNYEDGLLRFLSFMNPIDPNQHVTKFCPSGIDDNSTDQTLFRLYQENGEIAEGYDRGVLQMRVPHRTDDGMSYAWDNVYIGLSFFGEEYSGFSRPNVDGASNFLDGMNTMSMYKKRLYGIDHAARARWASSDIARMPHGNGSFERM